MVNKGARPLMEHRPSEEAVRAARDWLHEYGNEPSPLKMASDLAALLDQFAAKARLEEAKDCEFIANTEPFRAHGADDVNFHSGCVQTRERIVDAIKKHRQKLEAAAGMGVR